MRFPMLLLGALASCTAEAVELPAEHDYEPIEFAGAWPRAQVATDLGRLLPADAFAVLYVADLAALEGAVKVFLGRARPDLAAIFGLGQLEALLGVRVRDLDSSRAAAVALRSGAGGLSPVFVLPAKDPEDLADVVDADAVAAGGWVAISEGGRLEVAEQAPPIAVDLPVGAVALRIDLGLGRAVFEGLAADTLDRLRAVGGARSDAAVAAWGLVFDALLTHCETVEACATLGDGELDFALGARTAAEHDFGTLEPELVGALRRVPARSGDLVAAANYSFVDWRAYGAALRPVLDAVAGTSPARDTGEVERLIAAQIEAYETIDGPVAGSVRLGSAPGALPIDVVAVMRGSDVSKVRARGKELMAQLGAGLAPDGRVVGRATSELRQDDVTIEVASYFVGPAPVVIASGVVDDWAVVGFSDSAARVRGAVKAVRSGRAGLLAVDAALRELAVEPWMFVAFDAAMFIPPQGRALPPPVPSWAAVASRGFEHRLDLRIDFRNLLPPPR